MTRFLENGKDDELLSRDDVSYEKIVELQARLLAGTQAGTVKWARNGGDSYSFSTPYAEVDVSASSIAIFDDRGVRLRKFAPDSDVLYTAIDEWSEGMAQDIIDRILADLDAS